MSDKIEVDPMLVNVLNDITEGNPGALALMMRVITEYQDLVFPCFVYDLDHKGIKGSKIWRLFKDVHKEDFDAFAKDVWTGAPLDMLKRGSGKFGEVAT